MDFKNSIINMFRFIIENMSKNNFLKKQASFFSISVVIAWLIKDFFTTAIINKSFTGRSLFIQLIIFGGISLCLYLFITFFYRYYKKAHQNNKLIYAIIQLQICIFLASYLTIIFNFDRSLYELTGFFLFFLANLALSTVLFFDQHYRTIVLIIQTKKRPINISLLIIIIIFFDILLFNQGYFVTTFQNLPEIQYEVKEGTLYGFSLINGGLRSEHIDPNITFSNIDNHVRYIKIQCTNPNPDALSQVFYRREYEDWTEEKSIIFSLSPDGTIISLPRTIKITSLRLDLTNIEGDTIHCHGFTLNPRISYIFNYLRFAIFVLIILGLYFTDRFIKPETSKKLLATFISNGLWFFILLIILLGFTYPVTITFDSGHYLWLADLIRQGDWVNWDTIRYLGFPLIIFISISGFGLTQHALLLPMILAQIILFVFSYLVVISLLEPKKQTVRMMIALTVFLVIGLDPTVMGYYHTLLTEYAATTLAVISVFLSIKIYKTPFLSKPFYLQSSLFLLLVPVAWHLKQPYIGAAFFPFFILSIMIVLRHFSWKTITYFFTMNFALLAIVLASTWAWYGFIQARGNPMREDRQVARTAESMLNYQTAVSREYPQMFLMNKLVDYLAISNYYFFDFNTWAVERTPSFQRANENAAIAHRMFSNTRSTNTLYSIYTDYTAPFQTVYAPPPWVNNLFVTRITLSNSIFTITFLSLPFFVGLVLVVWIKHKTVLNAGILILSASSLINALAHLFLAPSDRYMLWGYVLNLLVLIILSIILLIWFKQRTKTH